MFSYLWNLILYRPLLNALAFLVSLIPGGDIGIAVIILTLIVKLILFPLSQKSIESQAKMSLLGPELQKIKESGLSQEEQAKKTFDLYKQYKVNPFSGCLLLLIQIPVFFALYYVFFKGTNFDPKQLYPFIHAPAHANLMFLGLINLSHGGLLLAILGGISQYLQAQFMSKPQPSQAKGNFSDSFQRSMNTQMKYVFPVLIAVIAYNVVGAVTLYWITSNLFMVGQQIYIKRKEFTPQASN